MWFHRRMLHISLKDHVTNDEVLMRGRTERKLMNRIKKPGRVENHDRQRPNWIRHLERERSTFLCCSVVCKIIHALQVDSLIRSNFIIHDTIYLTANGHNALL